MVKVTLKNGKEHDALVPETLQNWKALSTSRRLKATGSTR